MKEFSYIAIDQSGNIERGTLATASSAEIGKILKSRNLELISFQEKAKKKSVFEADIGAAFQKLVGANVTPLERISFASHMGVMFKAGVPIIEAVETLKSEKGSYQYKEVLKAMQAELEKGSPVSKVLEENNFFNPAHLAVLKAGEKSGAVEQSLNRISNDLKRDWKIRKKVKGAMTYPLIITLTLMGVSGYIVIFVLPKVGEVFTAMDLKIPLPTKILLAAGTFLSTYYLPVIIGLVLFGILVYFLFKKLRFVKEFFTDVLCSLPVISKIIHEIGMTRFIRSLSTLLASGVSISESLSISGKVFVNPRYEEMIVEVGKKVKKGVSLTNAFKDYQKQFGGIVVKMCSVGEKSGKLAEILEELANYYEDEVTEKLDNFSTVIEPALMIIVGLGVGGMVLSIVGPIYQMMGSLSP
jgi:type II secretory pathway component PulF